MLRPERLDLDPHVPIPENPKRVRKKWDSFAVGESVGEHLTGGKPPDRSALWQPGIVVDHDRAVPGRVDIQLDAIGALRDGRAEGCRGVLVFVSRSAPVGDEQREAQLSSSFRASIQGSDMISRRKARS